MTTPRVKPSYPCPYCGNHFTDIQLSIHKCLKNPATFAAVREQLDDGTGRIIQIAKYASRATLTSTLPNKSVLIDTFGSWEGVAEAFDLYCLTSWERKQAGNLRTAEQIGAEIDTQIAAERAARNQDHDEPTSLHACAVTHDEREIQAVINGAVCRVHHIETRYLLR